jgi:hypothetical protein
MLKTRMQYQYHQQLNIRSITGNGKKRKTKEKGRRGGKKEGMEDSEG